jgi:Resolvase, N terminal domain
VNSEGHQKVQAEHLGRNAFLYVRQSTLRQVQENVESSQRQYGLRDRALALGWGLEQVVVIDCDQGQSGSSAIEREGFQQLVTEVSMSRAGIVMGLEVSRLARNSSDWHRLLEICALTRTLLLDEEGVYDPSQFNDRLLLGLNRPETQSTSNSTFCWTGIVGQFRVGARLPALQAVPPADISDVVTRKSPAERTAQPGAIQRRGDFGVGTPRR